ncbi:hypothetical protein phiTE_067 [Pectobacterium phage phiTE]|uniref:Uncharacterized protein n=1 Tax=Pectobacterium phage phiTE TaxID=1116482 RepID=K9L478_9CAUD|nr:hypothetical protein phiTE_067 [Pectobacterium phage phiTE]AEZ66233.1 hypothetical protein phiTE_067 [Pectobacterium phage phiTE]
MQDLPFYIAWAFTSLYSTLHLCWLMSGNGKVDNVGRVLIVVSWIPLLSFVMAFCLFVIGVLFFIGERILEVTGWLFGTDHEAYFGVKANRNKAFFAYRFPSRRKAK